MDSKFNKHKKFKNCSHLCEYHCAQLSYTTSTELFWLSSLSTSRQTEKGERSCIIASDHRHAYASLAAWQWKCVFICCIHWSLLTYLLVFSIYVKYEINCCNQQLSPENEISIQLRWQTVDCQVLTIKTHVWEQIQLVPTTITNIFLLEAVLTTGQLLGESVSVRFGTW